jgi:hypothetical protein
MGIAILKSKAETEEENTRLCRLEKALELLTSGALATKHIDLPEKFRGRAAAKAYMAGVQAMDGWWKLLCAMVTNTLEEDHEIPEPMEVLDLREAMKRATPN